MLLSVALPLQLPAQFNTTLYQFKELPQAHFVNPALMPAAKIFVGLPLLSGVEAGFVANGLTYNSLRLGDGYGLRLDRIPYGELMEKSGASNAGILQASVQLLSFGYRTADGRQYFSFDISDHASSNGYYPQATVEMLRDIQVQAFQPALYDQSTLDFFSQYYRTISFGYARQLSPRFTVGARVKYVAGLANIWTENLRLSFRNSGDGDFFETGGQLTLFGAGVDFLSGDVDFDPFGKLLGSGNHGFAFDVGFSWQPSEQLSITASATNLGLIRWKKDITYRVLDENNLRLSTTDLNQVQEAIEGEIEAFLEEGPPTMITYQSPLVHQYFLGADYTINELFTVGAVAAPRNIDGIIDWGGSVSLRVRPLSWLDIGVNYAAYGRRYANLGLGLRLDAGPLQVYALTDNVPGLFGIKDAHSAQARFGINLLFGRIRPAAAPPQAVIEAPEDWTPAPAGRQLPAPLGYDPEGEAVVPRNDVSPVYFTLSGVVKDQASLQRLNNVVVDIYEQYRLDSSLIYSQRFRSGRFEVSIFRDRNYSILVRRGGYDTERLYLSAGAVAPDDAVISEEILMSRNPLVPEPGVIPMEAPAAPPEDTAPAAASSPAPSMPEAAYPPGGEYVLTAKTSLREGPTHRTRVMIRFRPGDRVKVLERTERNWWKVSFRGMTGYVKSFLLEYAPQE